MAWTTISLVSTGDLATAAVQNTQVLGNLNEVRAGGLALPSQAANDVIIASSATQLDRTPIATFGTEILLHAGSGTDASAGATNLDTFAISGLTAKDTLKILYNIGSAAQQTASAQVYSTTDSIKLADMNNGVALAAGTVADGEITIRQDQSANTLAQARDVGMVTGGALGGTRTSATLTTPWTGSFSVALRHGGVTAGGTFRYSWAVYRIKGQ